MWNLQSISQLAAIITVLAATRRLRGADEKETAILNMNFK